MWKCDFDNHKTDPPCGIRQATDEDGKQLNWTLHSGPTKSKKTGPEEDHTPQDFEIEGINDQRTKRNAIKRSSAVFNVIMFNVIMA